MKTFLILGSLMAVGAAQAASVGILDQISNLGVHNTPVVQLAGCGATETETLKACEANLNAAVTSLKTQLGATILSIRQCEARPGPSTYCPDVSVKFNAQAEIKFLK